MQIWLHGTAARLSPGDVLLPGNSLGKANHALRATAAKQPPAVLYHYTSQMHLPVILQSGHLKLTESNIELSGAGPGVVWLTTTPTGDGNGVYGFKSEVKITVRTPPETYWWPEWSREQGIEEFWYNALAKAAEGNPDNWWVCTREIPLAAVEQIEVNGKPVDFAKTGAIAGLQVEAGDLSSNDPERYDHLTSRYTPGFYGGDPLIDSRRFGPYLLQATGPVDDEGDRMVVVTLEGQVVADCFFGLQPGNESHIEGAVQVHPAYRRQGIATAMYSWIEQLTGKKMAPGAGHSTDAEGLWSQPNRAFGKVAFPSWRDRGHPGIEHQYEAVIAPDHSREGRRYLVYTYGEPVARPSSLAAAKAYVEDVYGPQQWTKIPGDTEPHHDSVHGTTPMFNDSPYVLVVDRLPRLSTTAALQTLYHATRAPFLESIRREGLKPGEEHGKTYLADDPKYALDVVDPRAEHMDWVVLTVDAIGLDLTSTYWGYTTTETIGPERITFPEVPEWKFHVGIAATKGYGGGPPVRQDGLAALAADYWMGHRPDENGGPAYNLLEDDPEYGGARYPGDIYTHPQHYTGFAQMLPETMRTLQSARGNPNAQITVYRAQKAGQGLNTGDWVSLSRAYAQQDLDSYDEGKGVRAVEVYRVAAKDVRFAGDDLMEWGYWGLPIRGKVATAAPLPVWRPTKGMFAPGSTYLDPRVFDGQHLRPEVRSYALDSLDAYWRPQFGDWTQWARLYLAGSGASYWWDSDGDLDFLIGVNLEQLRQVRPANREVADEEILAHLNRGLHDDLRPRMAAYQPIRNMASMEVTYYCNPDSYDILDISPYAAYDVTDDGWVVKPPVLPANWGPDSIPDSTWRKVDLAVREAQEVLALPEPDRTLAGTVLFDWFHEGRQVSYSPHGGGWLDEGNVIYQALTQHPDHLLRRLYLCKHPEQATTADAIEKAAGGSL